MFSLLYLGRSTPLVQLEEDDEGEDGALPEEESLPVVGLEAGNETTITTETGTAPPRNTGRRTTEEDLVHPSEVAVLQPAVIDPGSQDESELLLPPDDSGISDDELNRLLYRHAQLDQVQLHLSSMQHSASSFVNTPKNTQKTVN